MRRNHKIYSKINNELQKKPPSSSWNFEKEKKKKKKKQTNKQNKPKLDVCYFKVIKYNGKHVCKSFLQCLIILFPFSEALVWPSSNVCTCGFFFFFFFFFFFQMHFFLLNEVYFKEKGLEDLLKTHRTLGN